MVYKLCRNDGFVAATASGVAGRNLRLLLNRPAGEFRHETADAVLELAVLGGVDERIDAAVHLEQEHGDVVEPSLKSLRVDGAADEVDEDEKLIWRPAHDEPAHDVSQADHQRRHQRLTKNRRFES